jgi:hypothetical protein
VYFKKKICQSTDEAEDGCYHSHKRLVTNGPSAEDKDDDRDRYGGNCDSELGVCDADDDDQELNLEAEN